MLCPVIALSTLRTFVSGVDKQEREAAESAERGRGAAVIAAQLVERQEACLAAEAALKQVRSCCRACTTSVACSLP
jgi:hypothetical protein